MIFRRIINCNMKFTTLRKIARKKSTYTMKFTVLVVSCCLIKHFTNKQLFVLGELTVLKHYPISIYYTHNTTHVVLLARSDNTVRDWMNQKITNISLPSLHQHIVFGECNTSNINSAMKLYIAISWIQFLWWFDDWSV